MKITKTKGKAKKQLHFRDNITVSFSIPRPVWGGREGKRFLDIFKKYHNFISLEKFSTESDLGKFKDIPEDKSELLSEWEPYMRRYLDPDTREIVEEKVWVDCITFKTSRRNPKFKCYIEPSWGERIKKHCSILLTFTDASYFIEKEEEEIHLWSFLRDLAEYANCDFGSIQFATALQEKEYHLNDESDVWGIYAHRGLGKGLPSLYLVNVFGPPYIRLFGKEKILSTECYKVKELHNGSIWLQFLPGLPRTQDDFMLFNKRRQQAIEHLDKNAIQKDKWSHWYKYDVPEFDLSALQAPIKVPKE